VPVGRQQVQQTLWLTVSGRLNLEISKMSTDDPDEEHEDLRFDAPEALYDFPITIFGAQAIPFAS
jgi:hypothetical protein